MVAQKSRRWHVPHKTEHAGSTAAEEVVSRQEESASYASPQTDAASYKAAGIGSGGASHSQTGTAERAAAGEDAPRQGAKTGGAPAHTYPERVGTYRALNVALHVRRIRCRTG